MSDTYRETLYRWATQHIPKGAVVTDVKIEYSRGGAYSEWTIEDPSLDVTILYRSSDGAVSPKWFDNDDAVKLLSDMGKLLTELFALEAS